MARWHRPAGLAALVATALLAAPPTPVEADSTRGDQWWLGALQMDQVWRLSRGQGVTVALLDSGVDPNHPDLAGSVVTGPDLYQDGAKLGDPDWGQHGTSMASIIAGHGHGSQQSSGLMGAAPAARILSVRVNGDAGGRPLPNSPAVSALATGIRYAVDQGARVVNMSLGTEDMVVRPARSDEMDAITYASEHGVVVVASAGNSGETTNETKYPAAYPGVIAVGAVDQTGSPAPFSERGWYVSVSAPGVAVPGALPGGAYGVNSGTSQAGAFVAGLAADLLARQPSLSPLQVRRVLETSASAPERWTPAAGSGEVRPMAALEMAAATAGSAAVPTPAPSSSKTFRPPSGAGGAGTVTLPEGPSLILSLGLLALAVALGSLALLAVFVPRARPSP